MPWSSLADTVLAGTKRGIEIDVENQSDYEAWLSELYSEIKVFVKRVNNLDFEEPEDRDKFYELNQKFSTRFQDLRERSESSNATAEAVIEIEELIEELEDTPSVTSISVSYIGESPAEKARREQQRKEREQERIETALAKRDKIADQIRQVISALD